MSGTSWKRAAPSLVIRRQRHGKRRRKSCGTCGVFVETPRPSLSPSPAPTEDFEASGRDRSVSARGLPAMGWLFVFIVVGLVARGGHVSRLSKTTVFCATQLRGQLAGAVVAGEGLARRRRAAWWSSTRWVCGTRWRTIARRGSRT